MFQDGVWSGAIDNVARFSYNLYIYYVTNNILLMIEYKYNKKEDILYIRRYGEVSLDDMIEYINNISKQFSDHKSLYLLTDTRESITKFTIEDFPFILSEIKKQLRNYEGIKDAIIVESSLQTAFSILFENMSNELKNYHYKAFSTVTAAKKWLKKRN